LHPALNPQAAQAQLQAVRAEAYAQSRNHVEGAVTGLSPFITHGLLHVPEVVATLQLPPTHKLSFQLGWREYFHHVWQHEGEAIFQSLHAGPLPDEAYARELPADLLEGRTGVPAIDRAVQCLYRTGQLHNHARLWLAAYAVHGRKLHWRAGADWLYAHLLDGDLASNHLSWQWVAGTGSHKPYLFNADNVARFAPKAWHSSGTPIDRSYEALDAWARTPRGWDPIPPNGPSTHAEPARQAGIPAGLGSEPEPAQVAGQRVWLVHPWSLATPPEGFVPVAVLDEDFHARWAWSDARWQGVGERLREISTSIWRAPSGVLLQALAGAASVSGIDNLHLDRRFAAALKLQPMPRAFGQPAKRCRSFSAFWKEAAGEAPSAHWRG
jgi:deoxyribodipyrimidine photo-lyase